MASTKPEYRLAPKAIEDMEGIWLYSFKRWGEDQAGRYTDGLIAGFEFLVQNPEAGMACDHIRLTYRRYLIKRHVAFYRVTRYGIKIVRVLHDRMLPERHL